MNSGAMIKGFLLATMLWAMGLAVTVSCGVILGANLAPLAGIACLFIMAWVHAFFMCGPAWLVAALEAEVLWVLSSAGFLAGFTGGLRGAGVADILANLLLSEALPWIVLLLLSAMVPVLIAARLNRIAIHNMEEAEAGEEDNAGS